VNYRTDQESLLTAASEENAVLLMTEGRGPLTSNIGESGGFFRSSATLDAPNLQIHFAPVLFYAEGMGPIAENGFGYGPCLLTPTSRGHVTPRSLRPDAAPRIVHNYFATAEDRDAMVAGIRIALEIAAQPALANLITGPFDIPETDDQGGIFRWAQRTSGTLYHPTSTCSIGAVVDPDLRVLGIDGLRVVDASVFPTVPRGNTNAPTIMVAEKAADLIKGATA
jgi:choline dehydrogenase